jgi:hypothetical protein
MIDGGYGRTKVAATINIKIRTTTVKTLATTLDPPQPQVRGAARVGP